MANSPYENKPISEWNQITEDLVEQYLLSKEEILEVATLCWDRLWNSMVGGQIRIDEVNLPATVVGYFFQKLFAHELANRYPGQWKGEEQKSDKDLVCLSDPKFSTEMKASGQLGYSLFGNRSYNQESMAAGNTGKDKSGYYITLNFYGQTMTLLRIGWIDQDDWIPQGAQTGQAAVLKPDVYKHKLIEISGDYRRYSPIGLLAGVGPKAASVLAESNITTFYDLINYEGTDPKILKIRHSNNELLASL